MTAFSLSPTMQRIDKAERCSEINCGCFKFDHEKLAPSVNIENMNATVTPRNGEK